MSSSSPAGDVESGFDRDPSDLVALKISLLGDCQIGKTSFLVGGRIHFPLFSGSQTEKIVAQTYIFYFFWGHSLQKKYVGREKEQGGIQMAGLHQMDKTLSVRGARIAYSIWEVGGINHRSYDFSVSISTIYSISTSA